ncbi:alpha/beta hydrolase [Candidatus Binatia bacterium]|nr:alpha/beta hydrolase [Candidatus Binatia bacterium]
MPYTTSNDGARIHYEVHGAGDPVLMIMGLGSNAHGWARALPWVSDRHRAIVFDNRGVGRSDVPDGAYSIEQMADDAAAVLDACGHATAHVMGASLGGMIAQRFALAHAARVRSLVLLCTTPGGAPAVPATDDVLRALVEGGGDPATAYRRNAWFLYGADTREHHPERIEADLVERSRIPTTPKGYFGQLQAASRHDVWDGLPTIGVPVLVVHGDADLLVPTENGRRIASRIPAAELVLLPGAGHMLQADAGDAVRDAVLGFLERTGR